MRTLLVCAAMLAVAGCQTARLGPSVEGRWASDDGVFVATFDNGAFTSRLTGTGEVVVADGRYQRQDGGLVLEWTSIAANEQRAARCRFLASNQLACIPTVGGRFTMTRVV